MAFDNTRFTLMCFPQNVNAAGRLTLNIIFVPRNISPLDKVNTIYGAGGLAEAFVNVQPQFDIKIVNDINEFAGKVPAAEKSLAPADPLQYPASDATLYKTLRDAKINGKPKYFDIDENRSSDKPAALSAEHRAPAAVNKALAVRKYLPHTYRKAFNFTSPRVPNAVTDDSYFCAMRDQQPPSTIVADNKISWGQVYAHLLRQPQLAIQGGLLYQTSVQLAADDFAKGGWLYADIKAGTTYATEQAASLGGAGDPFIKRYAARIPVLKKATGRPLFAPVLFPVMKTGADPAGIFDELFIEAARFSDGFAAITHANQPVSQNVLKEEPDGIHPQKEVGIRLGWEDEQILIWYLRQLAVDDNVATDRLDAPLGVMGYHIDVKDDIADGTEWESLTAVKSKGNMMLEGIDLGAFDGELPFQVYPTKLYGVNGSNYWLPMYFSNWNNASLAIPDRTAASLYANDKQDNNPVTISNTYKAPDYKTKLLYGHTYQFRVRMSDVSGGGPKLNATPQNDLPSHIATAPFKRYIAPNTLRIVDPVNPANKVKVNTDDINFDGDSLVIARPLLGYPAVVYTGKYVDAIGELKKISDAIINNKKGAFLGIPDPDVTRIEVKVEVETLQMDNLGSDDGQEHFITLYTTNRLFSPVDFKAQVTIGITFADYPVLNLNTITQPFGDPTADNAIAATSGNIFLPTARDIRVTLRAVCDGDDTYWGNTGTDIKMDSRYGKPTVINMRRKSASETNLLAGTTDALMLQGIYLQPDPVLPKLDPAFFKLLQGGGTGIPDIVQRLSKQLNVACKEMTLTAEKGERIQFWCSNLVRHTLAPDNSSITFANKTELTDHWLVCMNLYINRDWTWDGLDTSSFKLSRRRGTDPATIGAKPYTFIGDLEMRRIASFQSIQSGDDGKIHREYTRIVFIDVIDMKPAGSAFPDEAVVQYKIQPTFQAGTAPAADPVLETAALMLPTTINPVQLPKLIGAGVALSPYNRTPKYSASEARQRYLWLEFDSKPADSNDGIFARVLAYSSDQLLSNNHPDQMVIPEESPLPVDPEYTRVIIPETAHEHAGLNAMQLMEKSTDGSRYFYLLPLPPGLHHESAELFGFFTYEFRYGHTDKVWSTAQGRFGRALRVTGLQHPAPNSYCLVNRDDKKILVSSPYAQAVFNGKNVTSNPPRTAIWCLLYAQVRQADALDYRNILLDEQELQLPPPGRHFQVFRPKIDAAIKSQNLALAQALQFELSQLETLDKESVLHAQGEWLNKDVNERLRLYGLPLDSPLSVLSVEVFGTITNIQNHINNFNTVRPQLEQKIGAIYNTGIATQLQESYKSATTVLPPLKPSLPITDNLGMYRILRTSPLTEVPFVCCTD